MYCGFFLLVRLSAYKIEIKNAEEIVRSSPEIISRYNFLTSAGISSSKSPPEVNMGISDETSSGFEVSGNALYL